MPSNNTTIDGPKEPESTGAAHPSSSVGAESTVRSSGAQVTKKRKDRPPCYFWKAGNCPKGDRCPFKHDQAIQEAEQARRMQEAEKDAAKTISRTFMKSTRVIFGAGASIVRIITGFESCTVLVKGLPLDATRNEVQTLFTQPGFDPSHFYVQSFRSSGDKVHQEARVVFDDTLDAANAAAGLNEIEFRDKKLQLEVVSLRGGRDQMTEYSKDREVLTMSWSAPSAGVVVMYESIEKAEAMVKALDRKVCAGRKVRVSMNRQPPGQTLKYFVASAIVIRNLPPGVTVEEIQAFSGSSSIKFLKQKTYDLPNAYERIRADMEGQLSPEAVKEYEIMDTDTSDGYVTIRARFERWEDAKIVHDFLKDRPLDYIASSKLRLWLSDPIIFTRTISIQQYEAQKDILLDIANNYKDQKSAYIRIRSNNTRAMGVAQVSVLGDDQQAVGALRVRMERLLSGEKLDLWDRWFAAEDGTAFLSSLLNSTGAHIIGDARLMELKAFGTPSAIQAAHSRIKQEVERLALLDYTVDLKKFSIRYFVREMDTLRVAIGEDNAMLDVTSSPARITIRGGEDARQILKTLIKKSLQGAYTSPKDGVQCPICFDDISNPFSLACGHYYCYECLKHFLSTASDTKLFPLQCLGDEGRCARAIPLPVLETILLPTQLDHLLEAAFMHYVDQHPLEYRYCKTPDCGEIYRVAADGMSTPLNCPSCLVSFCAACHDEGHDGRTCEEWRVHRNPAEQERLLDEWARERSTDVRSCPTCKSMIEKDGGCNHMICSHCGAHICWVCMLVHESGEATYAHLNSVHGGVYEVPADIE
ncbi:hypothetical protein A0H81_08174 [Grifola frondosa]|uniref:RBR-type E3 ubiquitin transferase n=1 Tax=Grifola frondosa TaxID=5627 RepID=A0A1C7M5G6_GRIFR|nr:hypothetical protein A0H81_08174 [Grifola frondosa]